MLKGIEFKNDDIFEKENQNNLIDKLTENSIIFCSDTGVVLALTTEILDILDGKHTDVSGHDYLVDIGSALNYKILCRYLPTTELNICGNQKLTITVEAPYVYTAKTPEDIWFATRTSDNRIAIYPLKIFKGYKEKWAEGLSSVHKFIASGRYYRYSYGSINYTPVGREVLINE